MRKTYSKDFKIKACELVIKDNIAVSVVAEKFSESALLRYDIEIFSKKH